MSIFSYGFNHTAVLRRCTGTDSDGDVQYGEPERIRCCFVYRRRETVDKNGNKTVSEATLYTDTEIQPPDRIEFEGRIWTAVSVTPACGLSGKVDHWEVRL